MKLSRLFKRMMDARRPFASCDRLPNDESRVRPSRKNRQSISARIHARYATRRFTRNSRPRCPVRITSWTGSASHAKTRRAELLNREVPPPLPCVNAQRRAICPAFESLLAWFRNLIPNDLRRLSSVPRQTHDWENKLPITLG
jgi:hypothetical protein